MGEEVMANGTGLTILEEAQRATRTERQIDYAHPAINFIRIADFWTDYLKGIGKLEKGAALTAQDIARMMVLFKVARQMQGYKRDTVVDTAGYADCDDRIHEYLADRGYSSELVASMGADEIAELHENLVREYVLGSE